MVGLTQSEAEEKGVKVITGSLDFSSNEKAIAIGKTEGVIKVVAREADHVIIGAQIFGPEACDLIAELTVAVENGMTLEQVARDCGMSVSGVRKRLRALRATAEEARR